MVLKIGHRGAMGYEPENTLRSFEKAISLGVDVVELDVQVCATGELVVYHYSDVCETTTGSGLVSDLSLTELKVLDAGLGEKIPTLEEVLDTVDCRAQVNIEMKGPGTEFLVCGKINDYVNDKGWSKDDFLVSSFDHFRIERFKSICPSVRTGALMLGKPLSYAQFGTDVGAHSVNLFLDSISKDFVDDAHFRGLCVYVWTVNSDKDIAYVKSIGVDGIISNYPDRI